MSEETPEESVSGTGKLDEDVAKRLRFQDQCFLSDAVRLFAKLNKSTRYENFIVLDANNSSDAATLISKMNTKFRSSDNNLRAFLTMTPAEFAALVPKIRLYLIKYKSANDGKGIQQELVFRDWTGKTAIDKLMDTSIGRGDGVGITNFTYEFDGRDPATTENLIKASVTISFTDFDLLSKPIRGLTPEEEKIFGKNKENAKPSFLDLVTRFSPSNPNAVFTKLRASIGWMEPSVEDGFTMRKELKEFISQGRADMDLILYMTGHDIKFKEDGRIDLQVDFRAAIEGLMSTDKADVLAIPTRDENGKLQTTTQTLERQQAYEKKQKKKIEDSTEKLKQEKKTAEALQEAREKDMNVLDKALQWALPSEDGSVDDYDKRIAEQEENLRRMQLSFDVMREKLRSQRYRKILNDLNEARKIKYIDIPEDAIEEWSTGEDAFDATSRNRFKAQDALSRLGANFAQSVKTANKTDNAAAKSVSAAKEYEKELDKKEKEEWFTRDLEEIRNDQEEGTSPSGVYRIHYVYLGDIIYIAAQALENGDNWQGKVRLVTGPMQFDDPATSESRTIIENIADIPIALDTFTEWYYTTVIAKSRDVYLLKDFLDDVMTDLIYRSLGEQCFSGLTGLPSLTLTPVVVNMKIDGAQSTEPIPKRGKYPRLTVDRFAAAVNNVSRGNPNNTITYLFISAIFPRQASFNKGNRAADEKMGVYHFGIGRDRGIVHTINFSKVNQKYRKEALVLDQGNIGIGQLREVYNADINMVGNTLFRNGQYVYIDATTMGVSKEVAATLGMGGYYVITRVEGELSADGYSTKLTCKYNSKSDKAGKATVSAASEDSPKKSIDEK